MLSIEEAAKLIADDLFTTGFGEKADRLVLFQEEKSGDKKRDLGGWCKEAVESRVIKILSAQLQMDKP